MRRGRFHRNVDYHPKLPHQKDKRLFAGILRIIFENRQLVNPNLDRLGCGWPIESHEEILISKRLDFSGKSSLQGADQSRLPSADAG